MLYRGPEETSYVGSNLGLWHVVFADFPCGMEVEAHSVESTSVVSCCHVNQFVGAKFDNVEVPSWRNILDGLPWWSG